jgi:hypothetical protein
MAVTAGTITKVSSSSTTASVAVSAATAGTGPYTYQWYMSTTSGFSPGGGNIVSGATALTLSVSGLIPNVTYYFKNVVTDTGDSNVTATATQLGVLTDPASQSQNAFSQSPTVGMLDLNFNPDTISAEIDVSQATALYPGAAVKIVDSADGVPKVIGCTANTDEVFGFINFNMKNRSFTAGMPVELSQDMNVMYLYASAAIARGAQVCLPNPSIYPGSVAPVTGSSGAKIVGFAYDKAASAGSLIRVKLNVPSFDVD